MSFSPSEIIKGSIILILIDVLVIWLWAVTSNLGPGAAMGMFIDIPIAFICNLVIGLVLFFTKRIYSYFFFINCFVASLITFWIFSLEMSNQYKGHFDHWSFNLQDTTFRITKWNKSNEFSLSYSQDSGSSTSFLDGKCEQKNDTLLLTSDSIRMYIHDNKLYNFRKSKKPITIKIDN